MINNIMAKFLQIAITVKDDCNIIGTKAELKDPNSLISLLNEAFGVITIIIPALLIILVTIDFVKAITAGDEKAIKEAQSDAIKRVIIGVLIYFLPLLINIFLKLAGLFSGTCNIG